ncbi:DUF456 domain-containing protein [Pollutibacter soli]|uniref:DUF456 domain-containing protein n=1 Tax=Pollutibacter soli TaxID=3034157 RepID=UPI003013C9CD
MDSIWILLGVLLMLAGIAGSILPVLPGTPLCYLALLIQQLRTDKPFSYQFLIVWALIVGVVLLLDYLVPIYGTKRFGGSKYGIWGCTLGFLAAFWIGPWGIILGPFIGAFIGEFIANKDSKQALKAALGSFAGFLFGTLIKLVTAFVMAYYLFVSVYY